MDILRRSTYLDRIFQALTTTSLVLLTGARQVGKTTIMKMVQQEYDDKDIPTCYLNLEDMFNLIFP